MPLASTRRLTSISVTIWLSCWVIEVRAFQLWQRPIPTGPFGCNPGGIKRNNGIRFSKGTDSSTLLEERAPIAFASGHSSNVNLLDAIQEATTEAIKALPPPMEIEQQQPKRRVDLALVAVSSLYDGGSQPPATTVVPSVLAAAARTDGVVIDHLIGSSVAGCISSTVSLDPRTTGACQPVEYERLPAVSVTLCQIPATQFTTFHVSDVPNDPGRLPPTEWKRAVGLSSTIESSDQDEPWSFLLIPVPSFSTKVDDLLFGLNVYFPQCVTVGGIASTVSSLSRAKLYHYSRHLHDSSSCCYTEGCVGVAWRGDLEVQTLTAQGVKPVGGVYRILKGTDSTISAIVLDEDATAALDDRGNDDEEADDDDDDDDVDNNDESIPPSSKPDARAAAAQAYAKARIPKPVLAEANFLMRTLSDDEQAFMRRALLVGLEQQQQNTGGMTARTASELARLASGQGGYRFKVQQVASAGMKDGSVTFPLGSVQVTPGLRMRFFVRESNFARKEVETLWVAYKKALLNRQFNVVESSKLQSSSDGLTFQPAACWLIPTMDRGNKFFLGNKAGYESTTAARMMPTVPSISGFFSNGVIVTGQTVQGSASGYFLFGSRSGRPVYSPQVDTSTRDTPIKSEQSSRRPSRAVTALEDRAPRNEYGELILRRREVHAGRALTVSTVEWSVAEKSAQPTSALEGFMWDKETEVDRYRERVPLANLVSQCKLAQTDPRSPKPRDFVAALKMTSQDFVIIPEIKQTDPATGSLHRRFDVKRQTRNFTTAKAAALCVNCDSIFSGAHWRT